MTTVSPSLTRHYGFPARPQTEGTGPVLCDRTVAVLSGPRRRRLCNLSSLVDSPVHHFLQNNWRMEGLGECAVCP
jgi:hypothetical protein